MQSWREFIYLDEVNQASEVCPLPLSYSCAIVLQFRRSNQFSTSAN